MENEIDLRDLIKTIWKGKWAIVCITTVLVVLAFIYSYLVVSPTYESKATLEVNNIKPPIGSLSDYVNDTTSRDVFVKTMQSPEVIQQTIKDMKLKNYTVSGVQGQLNISIPEKNSSLVNVSLKGPDRVLTSSIIDRIVLNTKNAIKDKLNSHFDSYKNLYKNKMDEENNTLQGYINDYNQLADKKGLPLLILFQQNAANSNSSSQNDAPQYMLQANKDLLSELKNLDKATQVKYEQINQKINQTNDEYEQYFGNYNDAVTAKSLNIVNDRYTVLSKAFASTHPVSPRKAMNLAISFVLGIMLSVFIVLFRSYWLNSSSNDKRKVRKTA